MWGEGAAINEDPTLYTDISTHSPCHNQRLRDQNDGFMSLYVGVGRNATNIKYNTIPYNTLHASAGAYWLSRALDPDSAGRCGAWEWGVLGFFERPPFVFQFLVFLLRISPPDGLTDVDLGFSRKKH